MPLVHVSGFPKEPTGRQIVGCKQKGIFTLWTPVAPSMEDKLIVCFRHYLNEARLPSKYWITEVADIRNSNLKEFTVEFRSIGDALSAEEYMNTVPYYTRNGHAYNLIAKITDHQDNDGYDSRNHRDGYEDDRYNRSRSREYSPERYSSSRYSNHRDRSRSPLQDPSKLDLELELLRKKRLLIEEERRLLLEKKKLEMIKEYGVNAIADFECKEAKKFGEGTSTLFHGNSSKEFERDQRARDKLLRPHWQEDPADRARAPPPEKRALAHIPQFVLPCKIILSQMKKAIKQKAPVLHERTMLTKVISANLRRRFAIVLENKSYMPSDAIAKLYRVVYPTSTDKELIEKTLKDVKACHWPKREKSQKTLDKIARRKAEKLRLKGILTGKDGGDDPGTSTDEVVATETPATAVDVIPETTDQGKDVNPHVESLTAGVVKTEVEAPQVKAELNTSVTEPNAGEYDDWAENGVDWNDDDDDSKDALKSET